jgi:hypothetical protein
MNKATASKQIDKGSATSRASPRTPAKHSTREPATSSHVSSMLLCCLVRLHSLSHHLSCRTTAASGW